MTMMNHIHVQNVTVPSFMYGTAWKEDRTEELTRLALSAGFRAIDTANQRKHYYEAGVGAALRASGVPRDELFIQTKFTFAPGQDHRLPYDPNTDFADQVRQSFENSLEHLGVSQVDSYVLHEPWADYNWGPEDREVWSAMEKLHHEGRTRLLGVSNVSLDQLHALCSTEEVKPAFVQNRCFAKTGWDKEVREFCRKNGIVYQGFSLLTANRAKLASEQMRAIADELKATVAQVTFKFAMCVGMLPLTGTSNPTHMAEDLACESIELSPEHIATIQGP